MSIDRDIQQRDRDFDGFDCVNIGIGQIGAPTVQTSGSDFLCVGQSSFVPDVADGNALLVEVDHDLATGSPTAALFPYFRNNANTGNFSAGQMFWIKRAGSDEVDWAVNTSVGGVLGPDPTIAINGEQQTFGINLNPSAILSYLHVAGLVGGIGIGATIDGMPGPATDVIGLRVNAQTTGTNNTVMLLGTLTPAAGDWSLYSASADPSYFAGDVEIVGKLTVGGAIDPTSLTLADAGNAAYIQSGQGASAAVSAANTGRIRYNATTQKWQVSENTGAYVDIASGAAAGVTGTGANGQATFWTGASTVSGDNSFFWDNTNKRLGIGITTPTAKIQAENDGVMRILAVAYSADAVGPFYSGQKARGTSAAPTAVLAGDVLVNLTGNGYTGAAFGSAASRIRIEASENWGPTANGARIAFLNVANGTTTLVERMRIQPSGYVNIGGTTENALLRLDAIATTGTDYILRTVGNSFQKHVRFEFLSGQQNVEINGLTAGAGTTASSLQLYGGGALELTLAHGFSTTALYNHLDSGRDFMMIEAGTSITSPRIGIGTPHANLWLGGKVQIRGDSAATSLTVEEGQLVLTNENTTVNNLVRTMYTTGRTSGGGAVVGWFGAIVADHTAGDENAHFSWTLKQNGVAAEKMRLLDSGFLGLGTSTPANKIVATLNSPVPTPLDPTSVIFHGLSANGSLTRISLDAFGAGVQSVYQGRSARGTAAAPSATLAGDTLVSIAGSGYGATAFASGTRAQIRLRASETWTDTANGTEIDFLTTPNGTLAFAVQGKITQQGDFQFSGNSNAVSVEVSDAGTGRIRYSDTTSKFQVSLSGANYVDILTGSAGASGVTGTGTNNQITCWTGTSTVSGFSSWTYDETIGQVVLSLSQNANTNLLVSNANTGGSATAALSLAAQTAFLDVVAQSNAAGQRVVFDIGGNSEARINQASSSPLTIYTSALERMRIDSSGLVGIGTASPGSQLSVVSPAVSGGRVTYAQVAGAHTAIVGEVHDTLWDSARTVTVTAAFATWRFNLFTAPTISAGASHTITTAATVAIGGAPATAGSATISTPLAFWVQGGMSRFGDDLILDNGANIQTGTGSGTQIATATSQKLGFFGATAIVQPTATGSRGGNAALASLLTELANLGLIVDGTSA